MMHSRGEHLRNKSTELKETIAVKTCIVCCVPFIFCFVYSLCGSGWSEYQQAKTHVRKFQSTTCRIENINIEEIPIAENGEVKTTSVNASYLIKVVNSTNDMDLFRSATVPLLRKPEQRSLVSRKNRVNSDLSSLRQITKEFPFFFLNKKIDGLSSRL